MLESQANAGTTDRQLELELIRVRAEAAAARLEARAAELELMLLAYRPRPVGAPQPAADTVPPAEPVAAEPVASREDVAGLLIASIQKLVAQRHPAPGGAVRVEHGIPANGKGAGGDGWDSRLHAARGRGPELPQADTTSASDVKTEVPVDKASFIRVDAAENPVRKPRMRVDQPLAVSIRQSSDSESRSKRWRPAGWLISVTAHVVVLLALGLLTLASPKPKDQLAFTAAVSQVSETTVENFTIESAEELPEVMPPTETAADVSPLGTLQVAEVALDLPMVAAPANDSAMAGEMASDSMRMAMASLKGNTPSKVQFAGLDGGGNHFVYLVDKSKSMRKFNEARMELIRSVDSLQPDQRFYVVFYDEKPDYMRISHPARDEPASVYASTENKQAFRRWAMTIQQGPGKSPVDVLKFAFTLRPDVIFLLSDGEFSALTETVIRERNRQENLFGDSGPISIIHTIRYPGYSKAEAERADLQMRRIAVENNGQYRNVEFK